MDDGQVVLLPRFAKAYLQAFDAALESIGGTRVAGDEVKSEAKLIGPQDDVETEGAAWRTGIVEDTCILRNSMPGATKVLGVDLDGSHLGDQIKAALDKTADICQKLGATHDTPVELALLRMCANVSRLTHLLRAAGPELRSADMDLFDESQRTALDRLLGCELSDTSYLRATQAAKDGGLGLRKASDLRPPAFLASRADAKGLAELLTLTMPNGIKDNLFRYWEHTSTSAIEEWNETIPYSTGQVAEAILSEADAQSRARAGATSSNPTRTNNAIGDARLASRVKEAIISAAGLEDPEHPSNAGIGTQSRLTDLTAALALERLTDHLRATNQHADVELAQRPTRPWLRSRLDVGTRVG